jgi:RNA polymerase sigma-70 factor (ECF subfamily)
VRFRSGEADASTVAKMLSSVWNASTDRNDTDDGPLVLAAQGGDRAALETLLHRHQDRVHALCRRITGSSEDALDATQEALIAIVRGIGRFDGRSSFSTWVYRVSTNAALDELRRRRRRPVPGLPDAGEALDDEMPVSQEARAVQPDRSGSAVARVDVDRALRRLPPDQRAAVVLRDLLDLDYAEIAEVLEVPVGTVRSRIARGRAALAESMRDAPGNQSTLAERPISGTPGANR